MSIVKKSAAGAVLTATALVSMAGVANAGSAGHSDRVVEETASYNREVVKESYEYTRKVVENTHGHSKMLVRHGNCYLYQDGKWLFVGHYKDGKVVHPEGKGTLLDLNLDLDLRVLQDSNGDSLIKVTL